MLNELTMGAANAVPTIILRTNARRSGPTCSTTSSTGSGDDASLTVLPSCPLAARTVAHFGSDVGLHLSRTRPVGARAGVGAIVGAAGRASSGRGTGGGTCGEQ